MNIAKIVSLIMLNQYPGLAEIREGICGPFIQIK
jgi:hypothetical protein